MHKSTSTSFGGVSAFRPTGSVSVVQTVVRTNYVRNAKVAFVATAAIVTLLAASVLTSGRHPLIALVMGSLVGVVTGAVVAAVVRVWPIVRMVWWWATEIVCLLALVWLFSLVSAVQSTWIRIVTVIVVVGLLVLIPPVRRWWVAMAWCVITRHRLRVCFHDVIKSNMHGSLPLILWARPTKVGERIWIFLRPGLSKTDLCNRLERLAVVCWASSVVVEQPGSNAAFLRVDVKRRDVLARTISSPLVPHVKPATPRKPARSTATLIPPDLDLGSTLLVTRYKASSAHADKEPAATPAANPVQSATASDNTNGLHDWL